MTDKSGLPVTDRELRDALADLDAKNASPAETQAVQGGSRVQQNAHEMKKSLITNLPR